MIGLSCASDRIQNHDTLLEAVRKLHMYKHAARASESIHCKIYSLTRGVRIEKFAGAVSRLLLTIVMMFACHKSD